MNFPITPTTTFALALTFALPTFALSTPAQAAPSAQEIIGKANIAAYYQGNDGRAKVRMKIVDAQGRKRLRQFTILRRDIKDGGDQSFLVLFSRPADVKRTVFLVQKKVRGDDDRWMYLPALDLVKRIASSDKRTSFVGSHFFYEDISGRSVHEDNHQLQKTTDTHYVIRSTPKKAGSVEFKYSTAWVDKKNYLPTKIEYVDKSGKLYRRIEALRVKTVQGHATVTKMKASDLKNGGHTITMMKGVKYDLSVPSTVFAERSLRNPPRQWFKKL
ncbi:MAG: outer membrane lipoprotein-sorting protein [Deltaproteobacteria bacterium]|nr:outer membrane lipoprotein-sorting protein [Deltaproteobacteria bacterium]